MRTFGFAVGVTALLLAAAPARSGDDDKAARAILDQAIKAHGGDALAKVKAHYFKGTGTIHMGGDFNFSAELYLMGLTHSKATIDVMIEGQTIRLLNVHAGDKGWQK